MKCIPVQISSHWFFQFEIDHFLQPFLFLKKITVQDGKYSDLTGLKPIASWSNSNEVGDLDVDYGIKADVRVTKDIASLPQKIWGKVSSQIGSWGVSARADFQGLDYTNADIKIGTENKDVGLNLSIGGNCGIDGIALDKIEGNKLCEADGAKFNINPRYDVQSEEATVGVSYEKEGTSINVEASKDTQSLTISSQLDEENRIAPTFSNTGGISIEWEHAVGDSVVTTTFTPEKSVRVDWEEGGWKTNILMDLEKTDITNVKVSVKKDLIF